MRKSLSKLSDQEIREIWSRAKAIAGVGDMTIPSSTSVIADARQIFVNLAIQSPYFASAKDLQYALSVGPTVVARMITIAVITLKQEEERAKTWRFQSKRYSKKSLYQNKENIILKK